MPTYVAIGNSRSRDSYQAGYEASKKAYEGISGRKPDITIAFGSASFNQKELIAGIRKASNNVPLAGCSTAGEITNDGPAKNSVAVMAISSDNIKFSIGIGSKIKDGAREAGQAVANFVKSNASDNLAAFVMFPDILTGNGADVVRGVLDILGPHFPVVGGAAGDDFKFEKTYQYYNDEVVDGTVVGIGISGKFTMGIGVQHGWMPIGLPMKVTRSSGSILYELDGRPAVSIYEDYFGEKVEELRKEPLARMAITYPLGVKTEETQEYLIRDPITVNQDGSITCTAEIPQGAEVRLMIGSKDKAIEAAKKAANHAVQQFQIDQTVPKLLLIFNCIAREKLFGEEAKNEISAVREIIGRQVPTLGFYTYGEQAPANGEIADKNKCHSLFYNETVVLFALGE